jgi:ATP-dependent exoDNAse (exonuclease V) alpha subunit
MVGAKLFEKIDRRLREFKDQADDFGGSFVFLFGDMNQLPPVLDHPLFKNQSDDADVNRGLLLFQSFDAFIFLNQSFRQQGQSDDQIQFRQILDRIGTGCIQGSDHNLLMKRVIDQPGVNSNGQFMDSTTVRLFSTNDFVDDYNRDRLRAMARPIAKIPSENVPFAAKAEKACKAGGLEPVLYICKECPVMLRSNLWTVKGLVNGALGTVKEIIYSPECSPQNSTPIAVLVKFENYTGPTIDGLVPIPKIKNTFFYSGANATRTQFPLQVAFATSVHKAQGLTLQKVVIDIGEHEFCLGITYVALSRAKTWSGFAFSRGYDWNRFLKINKHPGFKVRREFLENFTVEICS